MIRLFAAAALLCAVPCVSVAQVVLTLEDVVTRARSQSGGATVARARIAEAEALRADAGRLQHNPVIEMAAGPRRAAGGTVADVDVGFSQQLEISGQRRGRVDAAEAAVARAGAQAAEAARDSVVRAVAAFLRALAADEHLRLADDADAVARELLGATERRYNVGDVAAIDLNLARIEGARAGSAVRVARAERLAAIGELRVLLRMPAADALVVRGALDPPPLPDPARLRELVPQRPEFAVLEAEMREADAQLALARALRRPDLGVRAAYEREDGDTVVLGGLTVSLPAFQRGESAGAAAVARRSRARIELEIGRQGAVAAVDAAAAVHVAHLDAVSALVSQALPAIADNDTLARRSYDAGELSLLDLLRIRRDALETRDALIDLRLDAALSRLDVDFLSGVLR